MNRWIGSLEELDNLECGCKKQSDKVFDRLKVPVCLF